MDRARQLAGQQGYVTNLDKTLMDGAAVISAYHDLWKVEASFQMTKSDLRARPIFHHTKDAIEAHLTVVLAALAVSRDLQDAPAPASRRLSRPCAKARSASIEINGQQHPIDPELSQTIHCLLQRLQNGH